jgi:hypothetical protein
MFTSARTARRIAVAAAGAAAAVVAAFTLVVPATAATSIPKCTAADLGVWVAADQTQGAAGTIVYPLEFTNLSHHTCALHGFAGVSAIDANGHQLGAPAAWGHTVRATTVRLVPGASAHATLFYGNTVVSNCPRAFQKTATELRVYPPDQFQADHAFWTALTCTAKGGGYLGVSFIAPGIGVRG